MSEKHDGESAMKTKPPQKPLDNAGHICPWWLAYTFDNPLRRLFHKPDDIFQGLVAPGQTAMDIGCGMGYFTLAMARLVGPGGHVFAVDLQEQMLRRVKKRAEKAGLESRIRLHQCGPDSLGIHEPADFILAFWMVHEVQDRARFLREVRGLLNPQAHFLVVEPKMHVTASDVQRTVDLAREAGLEPCEGPKVRLSRVVLFKRAGEVD
jgi:2-polyprenyl-3-methyl-5-hydroxy-6-metoxy-1,4-benzoquinol methylase